MTQAKVEMNWEEFYSKSPKPINYDLDVQRINKFVSHHREKDQKIALVTSGGTRVPLEHNTVRFVDNFSAGTRGSASTEFFLDSGYVVIFLYREKSLEPFLRHFNGCALLDMLQIKMRKNRECIQVKDENLKDILPVLQKYFRAKSSSSYLTVQFTTLSDYLWLLRACCDSLSTCGRKAVIYLAAAVSDFFVPNEEMPIHKIQTKDGNLSITLQLVPKILKPLVVSWVPKAFIVSFKLETDEKILIRKSREALETYNHHLVIANEKNTRKNKVIFVTKNAVLNISVSPEESAKGIEIEFKIIKEVVARHEQFLLESHENKGQVAHESLLNRQDSELRLLDSIRKSLQTKVKYDREYSSALLTAVAQGQKVEGGDDLLGSAVTQSWKSLLEGFEFLAKLIRQNADSMEVKVLEKLNQLYIDKRKTKKLYQDEHNRVSLQFAKLTDDVTRKKLEYQKNLEVFKSMRSRLEEIYVKGGRGGKKIEEMREKYQKTCRKLHQTHNEYVLLLAEASELEKDFRNLMFPGLLESHQNLQESINQNWKIALEDAAKYSSLCTEQLQDLENRVVRIIEGIRPNQEYCDLSSKLRTSPVTSIFAFDETLIMDKPGKLQPNQLVVDNLTIDWLKSKLSELDAKIKEEQEKMLELGECIINNGKSQDSLHKLNSGPEIAKKRRELIEMRCDERKLIKQFEMIKVALNELGCEELPSGCDLSIDNFLVLSLDNEGKGVGRSLEELDVDLKTRPSSSLSLRKKTITGHFNTLMGHIRRKSVPTTPVLGRSSRRGKSEDKEAIPEVPSSTKTLVDEEWFHGVLPREEVVRLLTREGDFLVRETTRNDECQTVLSVAWGGHKHFIVQTTTEGHFRFEGPSFPTIQDLIMYQYQSGQPVTSRSGAILKKPILREVWELNNDDVQLLDKIGRGNFGDVYKARLKSTNQDVAVKTCRVALPDENKRKFLQEGRILKQYDHPNIVKLIGICVQKQPIMIVMELVPGGSLLTFLRNNASNLTQRQLLNMCRDAAAGMRYLESRNCIHRDLAARNCLIGYENMVKISDFGMSREEEEYIVSDGMKQIPIKWTAPEALNFGKYTSLCDVWSYGVLSWEIFARGGVPYPGLSNSKTREKIDSGYRMSAPEGTPEEMYRLMLRCWEYKPESRPHFHEIYNAVNDLSVELFGE